MRTEEVTRTREHGTMVVRPDDFKEPGQARIAAFRVIVSQCQYAKIDGIMVDLFSASAILKVYDAISDVNQAKYRHMPVTRMAGIAFKLIK